MSPQTETKATVGFKAGVKDYRLTYYTPDYETKDTDICPEDLMKIEHFRVEDVKNILNILQIEKHFA